MKPLTAPICTVVFSLLILTTFGAVPSTAQKAPDSSKTVTLDVKQVRLMDVLRSIFAQAGLPFQVTSKLEDWVAEEKITLHLKRASFDTALHHLLRIARKGLMYHLEKGVYVFETGEGLLLEKVTLTLKNTPLSVALQQLCDQVEASYGYVLGGDESRIVTLSLRNEPFETALQRILDASASPHTLRYTIHRGILAVYRTNIQDNDSISQTDFLSNTDFLTRNITVHLKDETFHEALWLTLQLTYRNFCMDEAIAESPSRVTASLSDVPIRQMLEWLLQLEWLLHLDRRKLDYRIDSGIILVGPEPRPDAPPL